MKFIHAADIHLDSPLVGLETYEDAPAEQIRGASRRALGNMVRLAKDEAVDFVLLAGDIYDGDWRDYRTGLFFFKQMSALRQVGIKVFAVSGNHDAQSKMTRELSLPDNTFVFPSSAPHTEHIEELSVAIHGQSYPAAAVSTNLSAKYPAPSAGYFNIGLLHTSADGREGHEPYAPCKRQALIDKGYDYWALGHVHAREVLSEEPWIVFPGNTQGRHIHEEGDKGCTLVTVDDFKVVGAEHRSLCAMRWSRCEVEAGGAETAEEVMVRTNEKLAKQLQALPPGGFVAVRVFLCGASHAHREFVRDPDRWMNEIRAGAYGVSDGRMWVERVEFGTRLPLRLDDIARQGGPIGDLLRYVDSIRHDRDLCVRLCQSLQDLRDALPPGFDLGTGQRGLDEPALVADSLDDIEQLLISRLIGGGGSA